MRIDSALRPLKNCSCPHQPPSHPSGGGLGPIFALEILLYINAFMNYCDLDNFFVILNIHWRD